MPPQIEKSKSDDDITDAMKRLVSVSSVYHPEGKQLQSSVFVRIKEGQSVRILPEEDELSSPTVSCVSFNDDNFSLESSEDILLKAKLRPPIELFTIGCDDLSMTSINTNGLKRIADLQNKLAVQQNTKLELLNQCMRLETELEKVDSNFARARALKSENAELREKNAKIERDLMNEISSMLNRMQGKEEEYERQLKEKEELIEALKEDVKLLQIAKNIDTPKMSKT